MNLSVGFQISLSPKILALAYRKTTPSVANKRKLLMSLIRMIKKLIHSML